MAPGKGRTVARNSAFWDSSALVPLCVHQGMTRRAMALHEAYSKVVWWSAPVEIASALARLGRMKLLQSAEADRARQLAQALADSWLVIQPSDALRTEAVELVGRYDLGAGESLHLAAALVWCQHVPAGRIFLTADQKLREAALLCGFDANQM